jgi:hypothetical protein
MPRLCPLCRGLTIIGHGVRFRQAHDTAHDRICVRRGICRPCHTTFTFLPEWVTPSGQFTLHCREQACERIAEGSSLEQALPECKDPSRLPDPSTVRRWALRRLCSLWCWLKSGVLTERFLRAPTIVAWDLLAACRILPGEARSP